MINSSDIREHMEVVGSDDKHVGRVDHVLGDQIEANLIQAVSTDPNPWLFLTRPISGGLIAASIASVALAIWQHNRINKKMAAGDEEEDTDF